MTTIPQRLREIARSVHDLEYGQPGALADSLRAIAAELEAPTFNAVAPAWTIGSILPYIENRKYIVLLRNGEEREVICKDNGLFMRLEFTDCNHPAQNSICNGEKILMWKEKL